MTQYLLIIQKFHFILIEAVLVNVDIFIISHYGAYIKNKTMIKII